MEECKTKKDFEKFYNRKDLSDEERYNNVICDLTLKFKDQYQIERYLFDAFQNDRYDLCQKILDSNYFEKMKSDYSYFCRNCINGRYIIFDMFEKLNISECVKLIMMFSKYNNIPEQFKDYIKDNNLKLHFAQNYDRLVKFCSKNRDVFKILHENIDVNNKELDKVLIANESDKSRDYCEKLKASGYNLNRIKDKLLEKVLDKRIMYSHFEYIKYLVELGAKIRFKDRTERKGDSVIVLRYLKKNNIIS